MIRLRVVSDKILRTFILNMHLIQILLPLYDNQGKPFPQKTYEQVKSELTKRFKGLTAYSRAPAEGHWKTGRATRRDEIIVYEIMIKSLNINWWCRYRLKLEKMFRQESIVVRAQFVKML